MIRGKDEEDSGDFAVPKFKKTDMKQDIKEVGAFCSKCGAWKGQLGLEPDFNLFIKHLCDIFDEAKRVLKPTGTCWVNLGDTYGGTGDKGDHKDPKYMNGRTGQSTAINKTAPSKSLVMIPFRFAIEMVNRGWILRNTIIWHKRNCMPSSAKDRFTVDFEYLFFFVKQKKYWFEQQFEAHEHPEVNHRTAKGGDGSGELGSSVRFGNLPQGRNMRAVWRIATQPFPEAHFAVYPEKLCETPINSGCPQYICKKCGKAREPIYESNQPKRDVEWHPEKYGTEDDKGKRLGRMQPQKSVYNTSVKKGLTDCNCNAGWRGGVMLDPFCGAGTTCVVAKRLGREYIGIELNPDYIRIAQKRLAKVPLRLDWFQQKEARKG